LRFCTFASLREILRYQRHFTLKIDFVFQHLQLTFAPHKTHKYYAMEQTKKNKALWWLLFFASTAGLIFAIYTHWEWLTLILPFQTTAFVKAMDIM
jgi:hypothetical protein